MIFKIHIYVCTISEMGSNLFLLGVLLLPDGVTEYYMVLNVSESMLDISTIL